MIITNYVLLKILLENALREEKKSIIFFKFF